MMVALVTSFAAIGLGELDPATFNAIDGPEVNAVRADHLHVLLYFVSPHSGGRLLLSELIAPPGQEFELGFLFGDAPRRQFLVCGAGICGCLLDQFADVFPYSGDAFLDLREVQRNVRHESSPRQARCGLGAPSSAPPAGSASPNIERDHGASKAIFCARM